MTIIVNGVRESLSPPMSVSEFLKEKEINSRNVVVEHNGNILKSGEYESASLGNEDRLEILRILGGG